MERCVICDGRKVIRLPVRLPVSVVSMDQGIPTTLDDAYREYACPECSPVADENRVALLYAAATAPTPPPRSEQDLTDHVKRNVAHTLIDGLLDRGYIQFTSRPSSARPGSQEWRGRIGVVSTGAADSIETRIKQNQDAVARRVVEEAISRIYQWGSDYTGPEGHITKSRAADAVQEALRHLLPTPPEEGI